MKVYQLIGTSIDGGEDWSFKPIYSTLEAAEKQKQIEIDAYTKVNGIVEFECPYIFSIEEIEVK
jgi:hypothetical protein